MAAKTISVSSYHLKAAFNVLGLLCLLLLLQKGNAIQFNVGGAKGWNVNDAKRYNQWAEKTRFQIGDSLLFVYKPNQDSVLQVTKEDYQNCTTTAPLATFNDGRTVFKFKKSGPYYFISGKKENCQKNEKLVVIVLSERSDSSTSPPSSGDMGIAPAGEDSPTAGSIQLNPTPSPDEQTPSAASSTFVSLTGFVGTLFALSLVFVF